MNLDTTSLELAARDARGLAMDAVTKCKSGHLDGVCQMPAVSIITRSARVAEPSLYMVV